jgi:enamine deaminase RidA (YjgF/YER057c/UK114 family)
MSDQNSTESIQFINPPELESPPGYSHVVDVRGSRLIFLAGQTARNVHGELVGGSNLETQAEQAFKNISVALTSVGCTPRESCQANRLCSGHEQTVRL